MLVNLSSDFLKDYTAAYNLLEDVDDVYAQLTSQQSYIKAIRTGLKIIKDHQANNFLGLFLLHRHFICEFNHVFLERRYTPRANGHKTVLVTTPVRAKEAPHRIAPHRIRIDNNGNLQPLEFTTDLKAISAYSRLTQMKALHHELGDHIAQSGLAPFMGIGIFARTSSLYKVTNVFLEETNFGKRQSVIHVLPRLTEEENHRVIPTLWSYGEDGNGCCTQQCRAYCHNHESPGQGYCGHKNDGHIGCI